MKNDLSSIKETVKASIQNGYLENDWKIADIPNVLIAYKENKIGVIGGIVKYEFPDDEVYEICALVSEDNLKRFDETWDEFVDRGAKEFLETFNENIGYINFPEDIMEIDSVKSKLDDGINPEDYKVILIKGFDEKTCELYMKSHIDRF